MDSTKRLILRSVHVFRIPAAVLISLSTVKSISQARGTSTSSSYGSALSSRAISIESGFRQPMRTPSPVRLNG